MKKIYKEHEWKIIEDSFLPEYNKISESIFSLGNGHMGQRANFEESYTGESLQGNYIAGIYYPDKTRVGWWKNGYPEYFAKVLNSPNWIGINIKLNETSINLHTNKVISFYRELDMQHGCLVRQFTVELENKAIVHVNSKRIVHIDKKEIGAIEYKIKVENFKGIITISPYIDTSVKNSDANYGESFWEHIQTDITHKYATIHNKTKKTGFEVATAMSNTLLLNNEEVIVSPTITDETETVFHNYELQIKDGDEIEIQKFASVVSSLNYLPKKLTSAAISNVSEAQADGFDNLYDSHKEAWLNKWKESDIKIEGDISAQQGIRFNIFQLNQTYSGDDARLNIGPKGFTGEKYGGSTYWDTEAFCLDFYLSTASQSVAKNLLLYRYKQLDKAIENAQKLGFTNGAALFPMVTMNGEECHNEWEITFEEIHRNSAIAFAVYNYIRYTGDISYLPEFGLEVLIAISRFWSQRTTFSEEKKRYVILGVTGPNEYENNINNNWYTNKMAQWCLDYTITAIDYVKSAHANEYNSLCKKISFDIIETSRWADIVKNIHLPEDHQLGIILQQDGYLDKEQLTVNDLSLDERPINQHWSWDRILRSCFIKQADVIQGLYCLEDLFDESTIKKNFDFYEPKTVHESSLSPCIYSVVASKINNPSKAYELYLRTARLDLDDYNNEAEEGCHITSMAGTWLSIVKGFAGMRIKDDKIYFTPSIPELWKSYSFNIRFRENILNITVNEDKCTIINEKGADITISIANVDHIITKNSQEEILI